MILQRLANVTRAATARGLLQRRRSTTNRSTATDAPYRGDTPMPTRMPPFTTVPAAPVISPASFPGIHAAHHSIERCHAFRPNLAHRRTRPTLQAPSRPTCGARDLPCERANMTHCSPCIPFATVRCRVVTHPCSNKMNAAFEAIRPRRRASERAALRSAACPLSIRRLHSAGHRCPAAVPASRVKREAGASRQTPFRRCPRNGRREHPTQYHCDLAGRCRGDADRSASLASPETGQWRASHAMPSSGVAVGNRTGWLDADVRCVEPTCLAPQSPSRG